MRLRPFKRSRSSLARSIHDSIQRFFSKLLSPRAQLATLTLVAILQKSPAIVRAINLLKVSIEPATRILQKTTITAAALGSYHAVTGATTATYVTNPTPPLTINQDEELIFTFGVQNTMAAASSWSVSGTLPAGLVASGSEGEPLTQQGFFNARFGLISGTPTEAGEFSVMLQPWRDPNATGPTAEALTVQITVVGTATNSPPVLESEIPNQTAEVGLSFNYNYSQHFNDPDEGDTLSFAAELSNGSDLPDWLQNSSGTLTGTPAESDLGTISIRAIASDGEETVEDTFELTVAEARVAVAPEATLQSVDDGLVLSWSIQEDQVYSVEMSSSPSGDSNWEALSIDIVTEGDRQTATIDPDDLPETAFLRVASAVE